MTDVRMPDGTVITNVPDGTTQGDLLQRYGAAQRKQAYVDQAKSDRPFDAAVGGALYGPWLGIKAMTGNATADDVQEWKDSMAGLWSTPAGKAGTIGGGIAALTPAMMASGTSVPAAAAIGGAWGGLQPESDWASRAKNAAVGALGSAAGQGVGNYLASKAMQAAPALTPQQQILQQATQSGYKIAPDEAGQQSALQWLAGQIKTQQTMAAKNVSNTTRLAAEEVGLPPAPITREALDTVRQQAGQAYDTVAQQGVLNWTPQLDKAVQQIRGQYNSLVNSFKSFRSPETETLLADLDKPQFDAAGTVEAVKRFRSDGFANIASLKPADKYLGRIQLQAQSLLEDMIDQNLAQRGMGDAVKELQAARTQIAKTYSIQNALDTNGNVVASKLAAQLAKGKPLSGNLETIAQTAGAFPKSMQNYQGTPPALSALDFMTSLMAGRKESLMLGARPVARSIMASGPYQRRFIDPSSNMMGGLLDAASSPYAQLMERTLPPAGLLAPQ